MYETLRDSSHNAYGDFCVVLQCQYSSTEYVYTLQEEKYCFGAAVEG
jgi:hypothetical protein